MAQTLTAALRRIYPALAPGAVHAYRAAGWTVDTVETVTALTGWAVDHRTGPAASRAAASLNSNREEAVVYAVTREWLMGLWPQLVTRNGLTGEEALAWLWVYCGTSTSAAAERVQRLLSGEPEQRLFRARWRAVGLRGPLAWAAGLSPGEALEELASGRVTVAYLLALTALRGYRLPPLALLPALDR